MVASATPRDEQTRLTLTYREAGDALGVCERIVWQLVKDGELKAIRLGRAVRIPVTELKQFITDRTGSV
jgi:excisionase family DNA binding protein